MPARKQQPIDWSHRVDRILTRWNRLGKPELLRPKMDALTKMLNEWTDARNRLLLHVERLERELSLEEKTP